MPSDFLLYGSTGFVGAVIARLAVQQGLKPIIAGRNAEKIKTQATELGVEHRVFRLDDSTAMDQALGEVKVVLHCAGPYTFTSKSMVDGCLRNGTHYLDLTGKSRSIKPWRRAMQKPKRSQSCSCPVWALMWCQPIVSPSISNNVCHRRRGWPLPSPFKGQPDCRREQSTPC